METKLEHQPPVTWLMPVRNGLPYLPATLESIAAQTYGNHTIIAWDNGSSDGTMDVLRTWIPSKIPGKIVGARPLPLGLSLAALVEEADTELCARIDADDLNLPTRLQQQVTFLAANPSTGVVGTQVSLIDEAGVRQRDWTLPESDAEIRWSTRWQGQLCHPSVMFRRSIVLKAGNYRDIEKAEDFDLWQRVSLLAEIQNLNETLLQYRRTNTSSTGQLSDFIPNNRAVAARNAAILFPNIHNADEAIELWEATHPAQTSVPAKLRYRRQLKQAAIQLARSVGKPDRYFLDTPTYREQDYHLRRRLLKQTGLGPLLDLRRVFTGTQSK